VLPGETVKKFSRDQDEKGTGSKLRKVSLPQEKVNLNGTDRHVDPASRLYEDLKSGPKRDFEVVHFL
jgi:hypothetical protein